jgi:exodeoxyribonuclease VII small subunit
VTELTFDDALAELQRTIAELETGGLPLERTLALHERGAALLEHCETQLRSAELRMRQLVSKGSNLETVEVSVDSPIDEA